MNKKQPHHVAQGHVVSPGNVHQRGSLAKVLHACQEAGAGCLFKPGRKKRRNKSLQKEGVPERADVASDPSWLPPAKNATADSLSKIPKAHSSSPSLWAPRGSRSRFLACDACVDALPARHKEALLQLKMTKRNRSFELRRHFLRHHAFPMAEQRKKKHQKQK